LRKKEMKEKQRRISEQLYRAKPDLAADSHYARKLARSKAPVRHDAISGSLALGDGTDSQRAIDAANIGFRFRTSQDDSMVLVSLST
jgi:hypothetical protein